MLTEKEAEEMREFVVKILDKELEDAPNHVPTTKEWLSTNWAGYKGPEMLSKIRNTGERREKIVLETVLVKLYVIYYKQLLIS